MILAGKRPRLFMLSLMLSAAELIGLLTHIREQHDHRTRPGPVNTARNRGSGLPLDDVVRCIEGGVDPSPPRIPGITAKHWQLEIEGFPIRIDDQVKDKSLPSNLRSKRQAVRVVTPVRLIKFDSVPRLTCSTDELVQTHSLAFVFHVSEKSPSIEQLHEPVSSACFVTMVQSNQLVSLS